MMGQEEKRIWSDRMRQQAATPNPKASTPAPILPAPPQPTGANLTPPLPTAEPLGNDDATREMPLSSSAPKVDLPASRHASP